MRTHVLLAALLSACSDPRQMPLGHDDAASPPADAGASQSPPEACNGLDDNSDGRVDENCTCNLGQTQACYPAPFSVAREERCANGVQQCVNDGEFTKWGACEHAVRCLAHEDSFSFGETTVTRPIDIIWVIDQSGSMDDEIANIRANINRFAATIASSGADYRVIMLAARSGENSVCVPPPLAAASCADSPNFHQIEQYVDSWNSLEVIQSDIDQIETLLRPDSVRAFIVVTDDNSELPAASFDTWLRARAGWEGYMFNAIVGLDSVSCPTEAAPGTVYRDLATMTMGHLENICVADWGVAFDRLSGDIVVHNLAYMLTDTPFDINDIHVFFVDGAGHEMEQPAGSWHYDPAMHTVVLDGGHLPPAGTQIVVRYRTQAAF